MQTQVTFFKGVDWSAVEGLSIDIFYPDIDHDTVAAWLAVLNMERASYDEQFHHGLIMPEAFEIPDTMVQQVPQTPHPRNPSP